MFTSPFCTVSAHLELYLDADSNGFLKLKLSP